MTVIFYIIRDSTGATVAGPFASGEAAERMAAIIHTDNPPAAVHAYQIDAQEVRP